ncbi:hypothetical protein EBU94_04335, partial [bacterium]|nr:hypothetical protein [bacterium]
ENPTFISTSGASNYYLHINTTSPTQIESGGLPVSGITSDFDGDTRNTSTPDIGADEFTGIIAPPITYLSSLASQVSNSACIGRSNIPVVRLEVVTTGLAEGLTLSSLSINANGTSNFSDISSYRVYYTGTSSTFSTSNPITGLLSGINSSNIVITPSSPVTILSGTNYFWIAYNISSAANGLAVDAEVTSLVLSSGTVIFQVSNDNSFSFTKRAVVDYNSTPEVFNFEIISEKSFPSGFFSRSISIPTSSCSLNKSFFVIFLIIFFFSILMFFLYKYLLQLINSKKKDSLI